MIFFLPLSKLKATQNKKSLSFMFLGCFSSLDYTFWQEYQHRIEPSNMCFHLFLLGVFHSTALRYRRVAFSGSRSTRFLCFVCFFFSGSRVKNLPQAISTTNIHTHTTGQNLCFLNDLQVFFFCVFFRSRFERICSAFVSADGTGFDWNNWIDRR